MAGGEQLFQENGILVGGAPRASQGRARKAGRDKDLYQPWTGWGAGDDGGLPAGPQAG